MSIIGPRPQLVRDMVFMTDEQRKRHDVRPGLSGLAQVNGRNDIDWEDNSSMDSCESKDRGRILKVLAELTERTGFTSAVNTVNEAVRMNATDPDSLEILYRRTYADVPALPPLDPKEKADNSEYTRYYQKLRDKRCLTPLNFYKLSIDWEHCHFIMM